LTQENHHANFTVTFACTFRTDWWHYQWSIKLAIDRSWVPLLARHSHAVTLGELFTPASVTKQYEAPKALMSYGWEVKCKPGGK